MLDELGIDYVEGGYPGANPTDTQLFAEPRMLHTTFTAFGMTRRPGRSASNDPGLAVLLDAKAEAICFVAKSWDYHVRVALETTLEENLASIRDSVQAAKAKGREVLLDCEHFFDGYKANPAYALACAKTAYEEGARWVVLCDTNGGALPHEVEAIVARGGQGHPRRSRRHPRPQRHRAGGGEFACRGARRRPPDPGHAERPRRALRQRQPRLDHPDLEAQAGIRRNIRDRRLRRADEESRPCLACARRAAQPSGQPPRALCRRKRVRHQGRHPRLGDRQGSGDLRACRARDGRQPAQAPGLRPGRPLQRAGRARPHRAQGRQERSARRPPARRGQGARGDRLCLRGGGRLVRAAGAAHARHRAEVLRRQLLRREGRAARPERPRAARR